MELILPVTPSEQFLIMVIGDDDSLVSKFVATSIIAKSANQIKFWIQIYKIRFMMSIL